MVRSRTYTVYELEAESGFDKRTISYYISEGLLPKVGRRGPKTTYPQEFLDRLLFIKRCRELQDAGQLRAVTLAEIAEVMRDLSTDDCGAVARGQRSDDWIRELFVEPDWDTSGRAIPAEDATDYGDIPRGVPEQRTAFRRPTNRMVSMRERRERMQQRSRSQEDQSWSLGRLRNVFASSDSEDAADSGQADLLDADWHALAEQSFGAEDTSDALARLGELMRMIQQRADAGTQQTTDYSGERLIRVPITDDIILSVRNIVERDAPLVEELAELLRRIMDIE